MRSFGIAATLLSAVYAVYAEIFTVMVAPDNTLSYSPNTLIATKGDIISFVFQSGTTHSATQSSFSAPCERLKGGFDSGLITGTSAKPVMYNYTVNSSESTALFFYCSEANHCRKGMAGAINPNNTDTFSAYSSAAVAGTTPTAGTSKASSTSAGSSAAEAGSSGTPASATGTSAETATASSAARQVIGDGSALGAAAMALLVGLAL